MNVPIPITGFQQSSPAKSLNRISGMDQGNMVRIGKKPVMNYVVACVTLLNHGVKQVVVRARGQGISKAVDVVEMLRRSFVKDLQIRSTLIGSEEVTRFDGRPANISTIEILLEKKE